MIEEREENKSSLKKNWVADETAPAGGQVRRDEARGLGGKEEPETIKLLELITTTTQPVCSTLSS